MKKTGMISIFLGIAISLVCTLAFVQLRWDESRPYCTGSTFETSAVLYAGYPIRYAVDAVPAIGECGIIISSVTVDERFGALISPLLLLNTAIWSILAFIVLHSMRIVSRSRK